MENLLQILKKFITLGNLPAWLKWLIAICALISVAFITLTSCGTTRATVVNKAESTTTEIRITTNNPTSVQTSPDVDVKLEPKDRKNQPVR